jgi:hypothetical protein
MKPLGADSGLFLDLNCEHPAMAASRRRLAHMGPSSLCDRLAGSCPGEMRGEESARLFFRVLGRRLVVFEPVAEMRRSWPPPKGHAAMILFTLCGKATQRSSASAALSSPEASGNAWTSLGRC